MEIDEDGLELNVIVGEYDNPGLLHSSVETACRGSSVYIAEHPTDRQGPILLFQYLAGLKEFQSIWYLVRKAFGMVSRKEGWTDPEESNEKENIKITDAQDLLEQALTSQLIGTISTLHGNIQLDITAGSMSGTPAAVVYDAMLSCVEFVIDYFNCIEVPHFLDEIKMSPPSEKLILDFFRKLTERTLGKNLRIGDMARRTNYCSFTYFLGHIVTTELDPVGVSFRRSRSAAEETYMYMVDQIESDQGILWMLFDIRHEQLFTVNHLWKCQSTLEEEKAISKNLCDKMLYVGQINGCQKILIFRLKKRNRKVECIC